MALMKLSSAEVFAANQEWAREMGSIAGKYGLSSVSEDVVQEVHARLLQAGLFRTDRDSGMVSSMDVGAFIAYVRVVTHNVCKSDRRATAAKVATRRAVQMGGASVEVDPDTLPATLVDPCNIESLDVRSFVSALRVDYPWHSAVKYSDDGTEYEIVVNKARRHVNPSRASRGNAVKGEVPAWVAGCTIPRDAASAVVLRMAGYTNAQVACIMQVSTGWLSKECLQVAHALAEDCGFSKF